MEIKIRNRSRIMQVLALIVFMSLVWAYAQLEWGLPTAVQKPLIQSRGSILAADDSPLARSVSGKRVYPQESLAGQLVGMMGTTHGLEGIEAAYNRELENGQDIKLTIQPHIQASADEHLATGVKEHRGQYGSVIIMETRTGRILAASSYPSFDPNNWRDYKQETRRNRPFLDVYEPGSTVKSLVVAAALNEELTTPQTLYKTPMRLHVGGRWGSTINDVVKHGPRLTTSDILRFSSNVGMSRIVHNFKYEKMLYYLSDYGFGRDVDLPNIPAATGRLQSLHKWNDLVRTTSSFGQGMSSTTLQLAAAYNTLANDGQYIAPRLVEGSTAGERREVLRPSAARTTREILTDNIHKTRFAAIKGYDILGKTGTAQVAVRGGYSKSLYNSVFAGSFPADAPRVTVAVMVHGAKRNYHGSQLAAPIFRKIAADLFSEWGMAPQDETVARSR